MSENSNAKSALLVALAGVSWSFAGILGKFCSWSAMSIAGYRALVAALLLGLIRKSYRPTHTKWTWIGSFGVALTSLLFMFANKLTSSANAIVLQYAMTAVVIVLEIVFLGVKPKRTEIVAALFVMAGVVLCFCQNLGNGRLIGDGIAFASAFTWALVFFAGRMPGVKTLDYAYQGNLLCALCIFAAPSDANIAAGGVSAWLVATGMALCLFFGYLFFTLGMKGGISPTTAAIVSNIEPVLNPLWVLLFLHESPGWLSLLGTAIVLGTVTLYSLRKSPAEN